MPHRRGMTAKEFASSTVVAILAEPPPDLLCPLDNLFDIAARPNDIQIAGMADEREHSDHLTPWVVHGRTDRCHFGVALTHGQIEPVRTNFLEQR
jgi:hypothetical protein